MSMLHIAIAFAVVFSWGFHFVVIKVGMEYLSPNWYVACRFILVFLVLFPWLKWVKGSMLPLFCVTLCLGGLHFAGLFYSVGIASHVSTITMVTQLGLPVSLILAYLFLGEKVSYWRGSGILVAFIGVMIISFDGQIKVEPVALFWALVSVVAYSVGTILLRRLKNVDVLVTQAWIAFVSIFIMSGVSFIFEDNQFTQITNLDALGWSALLYTAIGASLIGHGGLNYLLKHNEVSVVMPFLLLAPVIGTLSAVLVLNEILTFQFVAGSFLTLAGLGLIYFRDWLKKRQSMPQSMP